MQLISDTFIRNHDSVIIDEMYENHKTLMSYYIKPEMSIFYKSYIGTLPYHSYRILYSIT